jgi:hypothetical protein
MIIRVVVASVETANDPVEGLTDVPVPPIPCIGISVFQSASARDSIHVGRALFSGCEHHIIFGPIHFTAVLYSTVLVVVIFKKVPLLFAVRFFLPFQHDCD